VEALEGSTFEVFCAPKRRKNIVCTHFSLCKLKPIWYKTRQTLDDLYQTITLEAIAEDVMSSTLKHELASGSRGKP
jgi:DNA-binding IscR family transcriptional regulator